MRYLLALDVVQDKRKFIPQIAEFIGVKNYDLEHVIETTSIDKTRQRRKEIWEKENPGQHFREGVLYRKGTKNSWEEELSPAVIQKFDVLHPRQ